ncbi:hypothetical protein P20429_4042 [Pseudoalteromonas sp. BSi20429]|nr:hypothetical protein P20429_4042 [Pseudoalteromonas sp. BSi20429]
MQKVEQCKSNCREQLITNLAVLSTPFSYLKTGSLIKLLGIKPYWFYTNFISFRVYISYFS